MYPVSSAFKAKIKETSRLFKLNIQILHSAGSLVLTDIDISGGSLLFNEASQSGDEFAFGGTVASDISFGILNKPEYADIEFMGATVIPHIGLETSGGIGMTWSEALSYNWDWALNYTWGDLSHSYEYVPLGVFNIDEVSKQINTTLLKAVDNMIEFDKPYDSTLIYPATLYQIYLDACDMCDVVAGSAAFPNSTYLVQTKPEGDYTYRDIIGYIAELSGTFAKINRMGALELRWYKDSGEALTPANRFDFKPSDGTVQIKGIMVNVGDTTYLAGSEDYAIDLTGNPLLQSDYSSVLANIYNNVKDTVFTPYESKWQGNPALEAGDIITQTDKMGVTYTTLITHSTYKYRGSCSLSAKGLPDLSKGYKGSTNTRILNIIRSQVLPPLTNQITTLEQAQINATQLIANMLGGYVVQSEGSLYIADSPSLAEAQKVWKWGIGGFGYSSNGVDGPYTTSITADGSIVAMNVAANIITANMVRAGRLESEDNSTWIDLDTGAFNFKDILKWQDGELVIDSPTSGYGFKALHEDGSFTGMTSEGLKRFISGTGYSYHYLVHVGQGSSVLVSPTTPPADVVVQLPEEFKGKQFKAIVSLQQVEGAGWSTGSLTSLICKIISTDYVNATITVRCFMRWRFDVDVYDYRSADFVYIVQY